jgi:hypothetical protein
MIMSREHISEQNHNIKAGNKSFDRAEDFKYLGTTLKNQNLIHEAIKNTLETENACYHLVKNLLSSTLLPKNIKI